MEVKVGANVSLQTGKRNQSSKSGDRGKTGVCLTLEDYMKIFFLDFVVI